MKHEGELEAILKRLLAEAPQNSDWIVDVIGQLEPDDAMRVLTRFLTLDRSTPGFAHAFEVLYDIGLLNIR
jgi:hypothetical protein